MKKKGLASLLFLLLAALTVLAVCRQSASFSAEGFAAYVRSVPLWGMMCAGLGMAGFILFEGLALQAICRLLGYRCRLMQGTLYSAADIYFSAITPSATGGQPASAMLMLRDGIPAAVATVALLMNAVLYTLSIFILVLLGLFFCPGAYALFGAPSHALILIGLALQGLMMAAVVLLIFHEKTFLWIADFFLGLGQRLHLLKNAESRRGKLMEIKADYRACAGMASKRPGLILLALGMNLLQRLCVVWVPAALYMASGGSAREMGRLFAVQAWVIMGSNSIPIPGGIGVTDYLFLDGYGAFLPDPVNLELLSRSFSFYSCILICALIVLISLGLKKKTRR